MTIDRQVVINSIINGIVFSISFLILSTCFAVSSNLDNRIVKIFWFYSAITIACVVCLIMTWKKSQYSFSSTDLWVIGFTIYALINYYLSGSLAVNKIEILILLSVVYFVFRFLSIQTTYANAMIISALILTGVIEVIWGLGQFSGLSYSYHHLFRVTGSLFNPGPYGGLVGIISPVILHYMLLIPKKGDAKIIYNIELWTILFLLLLFGIVLIITISRAAWIATSIGCGFIMVMHFNAKYYLVRFYRRNTLLFFMTLFIFISLVSGLFVSAYLLKKESADGRLLIWKVTFEYIKQRPLTGSGIGMFGGIYGEAQENWFLQGKASQQEELIADAPEFCFNDYLQIAAENGIIGLILFLGIIGSTFSRFFSDCQHISVGIKGALITFIVFACFSYPLNVLPLCIIFTLLIALSHGNKTMEMERKDRWYTCIFWGGLVFVTFFIIENKVREKNAYIAWQAELGNNQIDRYEETVCRYRALYPYLKNQVPFLFEYAQHLSKTGRYEESNNILFEAAYLSSDPMIRNIIGKNYQSMQQFSSAEHFYKKAYYMVPNRFYPLYLLAKMYIQNGQVNKAKKIARLIINKNPKIISPAIRDMKEEMALFLNEESK